MEEKFPAGMRVLAVDDDSTCLMILAAILRKCHYIVTTTNEAIKALQILRENKNEFDLVISDIDMPDMDGFELLQQVGRQMDIPVLSHDDKEWVMKGISNGACHYLLKPVRVEELRHIWQHVVRRKSKDSVLQEVQVLKGTENVDDHKPNKKRKDDDDGDQQEHDEDKSTQKKPRVVWLPELHQKFLAAVNQLGLDRAVPKRILELMNVQNITRENIASHLQKYRTQLKKRNSVPISPQANSMFAGFGSGHNSAYHQAGYTSSSSYPGPPTIHHVLTSPASQGGSLGASSSEIIKWGGADNLLEMVDHHEHSMSQSRVLPCGMLIAQEFDYGKEDISPTRAEFSSAINFGDNDAMLDEYLVNAQHEQELSGNLSAQYSFPAASSLPELEGYIDNSPTAVIKFQAGLYDEQGYPTTPSLVHLRHNMATSSSAAAARLVMNPPSQLSCLNSLVNTLPDSRTRDVHRHCQQQYGMSHNIVANHNQMAAAVRGNITNGEFSGSWVSASDDVDGLLLSRQQLLDNVKLKGDNALEQNLEPNDLLNMNDDEAGRGRGR